MPVMERGREALDDPSESWKRVRTEDGRIQLAVAEMLEELDTLLAARKPEIDPDFPLMLSAGERRSFTANTILRDPGWRKKDPSGALRVSPQDAERLGLSEGHAAVLATARGKVEVIVEVNETMMEGHVSLPNGLGVDYPDEAGDRAATGASVNELTSAEDRDPFAGTPWHKSVPAHLEPVG